MEIRLGTPLDVEALKPLYLTAFDAEEREDVADLAAKLLAETTEPATYAFVAEIEKTIVGHIAFSPVYDSSNRNMGYILAPLAVQPKYQRQQIGSRLIEKGLEHLKHRRVELVFVYGDPNYYGRFGFDVKLATHFTPPYELQYPQGWHAMALSEREPDGIDGRLVCVSSLDAPHLW